MAKNRKFCLPPSHLAPSFGVTPFEFIKKALRFLKLESSGQSMVKIWWP